MTYILKGKFDLPHMTVKLVEEHLFSKYGKIPVNYLSSLKEGAYYSIAYQYIVMPEKMEYSNSFEAIKSLLHEYGHHLTRDKIEVKLIQKFPPFILGGLISSFIIFLLIVIFPLPFFINMTICCFMLISTLLILIQEYRADCFAFREGKKLNLNEYYLLLLSINNTGCYLLMFKIYVLLFFKMIIL
jgi:hypothetical protein